MSKWLLIDSDLNILPIESETVNLNNFFTEKKIEFKMNDIIKAEKRGNITELKNKISKIIKGE